MNYEKNAMAAVYRCVMFAAAGDGEVSEEEIQQATAASEGTERWYHFTTTMKGALDSVFSEMFGLDDEEEEEEEEETIDLSPLSEEEIQEIGNDVLTNLAKCDSAADIKAYANLCISAVDEQIHHHLLWQAINVCGTDNPEWVPDKKETRNIKYLCTAVGENYKELEKQYLDSLTWYHDDLLRDDLTVEKVDKTFKEIKPNSPDAVLSVGMMAAYADGDLAISYQALCEHWFLALCDIARVKGESVIKIPEKMSDYVIGIMDETFAALWAKTGNPYEVERDPDLEFDEKNYEEHMKIHAGVQEHHEVAMSSTLELITDESIFKLTYKNATFLCGADRDEMYASSTMDIMTGELTKMEISHSEEAALEQVGKHCGFDEDQLYGLKKRIEEGQLGSLYSSD